MEDTKKADGISVSINLAWQIMMSNKKLLIIMSVIEILVMLVSTIPLVVFVVLIINMYIVVSTQKYIFNLLDNSNSTNELIQKYQQLSIQTILSSNVSAVLGIISGILLLITVFAILLVINVYFIFVFGLFLIPILYIMPQLISIALSKSDFKGAFYAMFDVFDKNIIDYVFNASYFKNILFISLFSGVISIFYYILDASVLLIPIAGFVVVFSNIAYAIMYFYLYSHSVGINN